MSEKKQDSQPVLKKEKKKRRTIIAGLIGGAVLTGGGVGVGIMATNPEAETEEKEEPKSGRGSSPTSSGGTNYKLTSVRDWKDTNGTVYSLTTVKNGDLYVGTDSGNYQGKLFKIDSSGTITDTSVPGRQNTSGKKVWQNTNGAVRSLLTVDNDIYVGTYTASGKGKLFKIDSSGTITPVSGWKETNGSVRSLTTVKNGDLYVGTDSGNYQGKLFKIDSSGTITDTSVSGWQQTNDRTVWQETNGAVTSLTTLGNDLYIGTYTASDQGKLFKIDSAGTITSVSGWQKRNGAVTSLVTIDKDIYVGTNSGHNTGKLFKIDSSGTITDTSVPGRQNTSGKKVWQNTNGAVTSLVVVDKDIYVGTDSGNYQGKLFKIDSSGTITDTSVSGRQNNNGSVQSLTTVKSNGKSNLYVGTDNASGKGKLLALSS